MDKQFKCLECPKTFNNKWDLTRHDNAVHKDLRPFPCVPCKMAFKERCQLNRHLKTRSHLMAALSAACEDVAQTESLVITGPDGQSITMDIIEGATQDEGGTGTQAAEGTGTQASKCMCCSVELQSVADYQEHLTSVHNIDSDLALSFMAKKSLIEKILDPSAKLVPSVPNVNEPGYSVPNMNELGYSGVKSGTEFEAPSTTEGTTATDHDYLGGGPKIIMEVSSDDQNSNAPKTREKNGLRYK